MAKWSNMDIFGNRRKFQQGYLGIGIYIERHSQHFEPNFQYMSRCLECLTFHLVSETLLGIKLWRKYVEMFHMLKIYFELGLLQVLTIYVNCELLIREGGKDKKKKKKIVPYLLNHAKMPWAKFVTWESQTKSLKKPGYFLNLSN